MPIRIPRLARLLSVFVSAALLASPFSLAAGGVDDLRVRQLENDLMRLQRDLDAQARRIDSLERTQRNVAPGTPPPAGVARPSDNSPAWLVSANWDRIRPGMKEIEVISLLGRPTSVRTEGDGKARAFLYALELGPNAILSGNVRLGDSGVTEINRPVLR